MRHSSDDADVDHPGDDAEDDVRHDENPIPIGVILPIPVMATPGADIVPFRTRGWAIDSMTGIIAATSTP